MRSGCPDELHRHTRAKLGLQDLEHMAMARGLGRFWIFAEPEAKAWVDGLATWRRAPFEPASLAVEFRDDLDGAAAYSSTHGFSFTTKHWHPLWVLGHEFAHYLTHWTHPEHGIEFKRNLLAAYRRMGDVIGRRNIA